MLHHKKSGDFFGSQRKSWFL